LPALSGAVDWHLRRERKAARTPSRETAQHDHRRAVAITRAACVLPCTPPFLKPFI